MVLDCFYECEGLDLKGEKRILITLTDPIIRCILEGSPDTQLAYRKKKSMYFQGNIDSSLNVDIIHYSEYLS
jgi:hypothetical protein